MDKNSGVSIEEREFLNFCFHNDLQKILTKAARLLNNPLAIFDKNYYTVAYSDTSEVDDAIWLAGKSCGCCSFEYAAMLHGLDNLERLDNDHTPYRIFDDFGTRRRKICPLIHDSIVIGYLSVLEYFSEFETGNEETYHLVTSVLCKELMIVQALRQSRMYNSIESLLLSALNSEFANRTLFSERFSGTELEKESLYQVVCIDMSNYSSHTTAKRDFKVRLSEIFPRSWSLFYHKYVILLVDIADDKQLQGNWEKLNCYLEENTLFAGVSDPFSDLYLLHQYYQQGIDAEKMARAMKDAERVAQYNQYKLHALLDSVPTQSRWKYMSNGLLEVHKFDLKNNTEYIATIFAYLKCGQSLTATAQELHIHRNTVVYRIGKIKENFGIDFSSADNNLQVYMGCLLLYLSDGNIPLPVGS